MAKRTQPISAAERVDLSSYQVLRSPRGDPVGVTWTRHHLVERTEAVFVSGRCVFHPDNALDRPDMRPRMHRYASHAYVAASASCSQVRRSGDCWALCVVAWAAEHAAAWFGSGSSWMQLVS